MLFNFVEHYSHDTVIDFFIRHLLLFWSTNIWSLSRLHPKPSLNFIEQFRARSIFHRIVNWLCYYSINEEKIHCVWKSTKNVSFSRTICIFVCIWIFGPKVIKINGARFARSQWGKMRLFEWFLNTMNILQIVYVLLDVPRKFWDVFSSRLNSSIFGASD